MKTLLWLGFVLMLQKACSLNHNVVVPNKFRIGAEETVVLNLHGYPAGTRISAFLQALPGLQKTFSKVNEQLNQDTVNKPVMLKMKVTEGNFRPFLRNQKVRLSIGISHGGKVITVDVPVSKRSGYLFITTARPTYKPDERVVFKIFPFNQAMRPDHDLFVKIIIRTPDGIGVEKISRTLGGQESFIEDDYKIDPVPELGLWIIEATYSTNGYDTTTQTKFKVDHYVLPTFQVKIDLEKNYVLVGDKSISGTLKAHYSYGKPVSGNFYLRALVKKTPSSEPKVFYKFPANNIILGRISDGERSFGIPLEDFTSVYGKGENLTTLEKSKASIFIEATVNGQATGIFESAITPDLNITKSPYVIDTSRTSPYYTPGLDYTLQVDVLHANGRQPAPEVPLTITVNGGNSMNVRSDKHGSLNFGLNLAASGKQNAIVTTNVVGLSSIQQATKTIELVPYQSPSNIYLQITTTGTYVSVGDAWQVKFSFNSNNILNRAIRYIVVSKGNIVFSNVKTFLPNKKETTETITITQEMVPSARLVAYYLVGSEVVANSLWFDVENQCKVPLSVTVPDEVLPGSRFGIEIQGPKNARVSLSGVDRAAYFLYNGSRLTPKSMFDKMESYDQGCIRNGGRDASSVFQEAGLSIITQLNAATSPLDCAKRVVSGRKKRNVANTVNALLDLEKCREDGRRLPAVDTETCKTRKAIVEKNNKDKGFPPGCAEEFFKACEKATDERFINLIRSSGKSIGNAADARASIGQLRKDFDEILVFDDIQLSGTGKARYPALARDSITTFEIDAVSVEDTNDGFCVAPTANVRVFKDVFVQIYAPYSLKKMEQANLRLTVFNYGDKSKEVNLEVKIHKDAPLCTFFTKDRWNELISFEVHPNRTKSAVLTVLPLSVPEKDGKVTVFAKVTDRKNNNNILDNVEKKILIEETGELLDSPPPNSEPIDLQKNGQQNFNLGFTFPEEFVPGTRKCWVFAYVNFLGPSIEVDPLTKKQKDIKTAFRMPYGCGEQTMLTSGPNVYTLMYLNATKKIIPGSAEYNAAIDKIKHGYTRELAYRSNKVQPKVFAVWSSEIPSTWLNAFVDKVFMKADLYTDLDIRPICDSLNWLLTQQDANGHFDEKRTPYHREMHGAVGGDYTLTAYVAISLMETQSKCSSVNLNQRIQDAISKAMTYLKNNKNNPIFRNRPYAVALLSYALALRNPASPEAVEMFGRLKSLKTVEGGTIYWKGRPNNGASNLHSYWYKANRQAIDVEATAYALLAQIAMNKLQNPPPQSALDDARKTVLWLIKQRNDGGVFISTQDTVIGLQALAQYQIWTDGLDTKPKGNDFTLSFTAPQTSWKVVGKENQVRLTDDEIKFRKTIDVPKDVIKHGSVDVTAKGIGEGMVSYRCIYRSAVDHKPCYFNISHAVTILEPEEEFNEADLGPPPMRIKLTITIASTSIESSEMSIIDVGLMSGFVPVIQSLSKMSKELAVDGVLDRYEVTNFNIILYISKISSDPVRLQFEMKQTVFVSQPEPAKINVYVYSEPFERCGLFYHLPTDSPYLRTTNCNTTQGKAQNNLCKCAEGGCLKCRTRNDQMTVTKCLGDNDFHCTICKNKDTCLNLYAETCRRNYAYVVNITGVVIPSEGAVFYSVTGVIDKVMKLGEHNAQKNGKIEFIVRRDCYKSCYDEILEESAKNRNQKAEYFRKGFQLFITGLKPDEVKVKGRDPVFHYRLDENSLVERYIPETKCLGKVARKVERCNKKNKKNASCEKARQLKAICDNYDRLENELIVSSCE